MEVARQRSGRFLEVRPPPPPWSDPFVNPDISRIPFQPAMPFCSFPMQNQPRPPICSGNQHRPLHFMNQPNGQVFPQQNQIHNQVRLQHNPIRPLQQNQIRGFQPPINPILLTQLAQIQIQNGFHQVEPHPTMAREHNRGSKGDKAKKTVSPSTALRERVGLSGYSKKLFVDQIPDDLMCALCQDVVRKPLQTKCCGQVYCKVCVNRLPRIVRGMLSCPHCKEKLEVFIDKRAEIFVNNMKIFCTNVNRGCPWLGQLTNLKKHLENCKLSQDK